MKFSYSGSHFRQMTSIFVVKANMLEVLPPFEIVRRFVVDLCVYVADFMSSNTLNKMVKVLPCS